MEMLKKLLGDVPKKRLDTFVTKFVDDMPPGPNGTVIQHLGFVEFSCVKPERITGTAAPTSDFFTNELAYHDGGGAWEL